MRDLWDTRVAQGRGLVTKPKRTNFTWNKEVNGKSNLGTGFKKEVRTLERKDIPTKLTILCGSGSRHGVKLQG